jgi:ubiquinone/menaquinone biosynthesis C-methylase UbiE
MGISGRANRAEAGEANEAMDTDGLKSYYGLRAPEYEEMYRRDDPARMAELEEMGAEIRSLFAGRRALEAACGTGWWTRVLADSALCVTALDAAPETLAEARRKNLPASKVTFLEGDAYALAAVPGNFDAGLACFWLSHVPRARLREFLDGFHRRLGPGALVYMADNVFVPGLGGERLEKPGCEDTFKRRTLSDGSMWEVVKNYYDEAELRALLEPFAKSLEVREGKCFWRAWYEII